MLKTISFMMVSNDGVNEMRERDTMAVVVGGLRRRSSVGFRLLGLCRGIRNVGGKDKAWSRAQHMILSKKGEGEKARERARCMGWPKERKRKGRE